MPYTLDDHLDALAVAAACLMAGTATDRHRRILARHCITNQADAYGFLVAINLWADYRATLRRRR